MRDRSLDVQRALASFRVVGRLLLPALVLGYLGRLDRAGVKVRLALEELGLTYLKFGQFMAIRHDVVPPEIGRELQRLFDQVRPVSFDEARAVVEAELGGPLGAFFASFDEQPIASASVAQVHRGRAHDGRQVAIKIQRPGIDRRVHADLRNLRRVALLIDWTGLLGTLSMRETIDEFAVWTVRELDFRLEADAADALRQDTLSFEYVPVMYRDLTTARVLTMELIDGLSLAELGRIFDADGEAGLRKRLPDVDLRRVLNHLSDAYLRQLFGAGIFHGDPHPGNIIVRQDSGVAFVDFGIVGLLTPEQRAIVRRHVEAIAVGNIAESLRYYIKQLYTTADTDLQGFRGEATGVLRRWYEASQNPDLTAIGDRHLGKYAGEMLDLVRRYHLRMSMGVLLFWRALIVLNSTALRFPGHYDLLAAMQRFFEPTPHEIVERFVRVGLDSDRALAVAELIRDEPAEISRIMSELRERQRPWRADLEETGPELRANNRQARGMALALVGLSLAIVGLGAEAAPFDVSVRMAALGVAVLLALRSYVELSPR
jgi:ubiquinone biosynthesis protein